MNKWLLNNVGKLTDGVSVLFDRIVGKRLKVRRHKDSRAWQPVTSNR